MLVFLCEEVIFHFWSLYSPVRRVTERVRTVKTVRHRLSKCPLLVAYTTIGRLSIVRLRDNIGYG